MQYFAKTFIAALLIVGTSELAKKSSLAAAVLISLPMTAVITLLFVYFESKNTAQISQLSDSILWMVLPSLCFFILLSKLLDFGLGFWISLGGSALATTGIYTGYVLFLSKLGIKF